MNITLKPIGGVVAALSIIILGLPAVSECRAQPSPLYIPPPQAITISPRTNGPTVSVSVAVRFPNYCYSVTDWGQPVIVGNIAYVDTQVRWFFWLFCPDAVLTVSTNYDLGSLPPGNYTFYFLAWGEQVKGEAFSVPEPGPPRLSISALSAAQARLSWPTNAADYLLERATALPAPEWAAVTNRPPVIGDQFVLTIDLPGGHTFYRLRRP